MAVQSHVSDEDVSSKHSEDVTETEQIDPKLLHKLDMKLIPLKFFTTNTENKVPRRLFLSDKELSSKEMETNENPDVHFAS